MTVCECGRPVPEERLCHVWPACHDCLPLDAEVRWLRTRIEQQVDEVQQLRAKLADLDEALERLKDERAARVRNLDRLAKYREQVAIMEPIVKAALSAYRRRHTRGVSAMMDVAIKKYKEAVEQDDGADLREAVETSERVKRECEEREAKRILPRTDTGIW